jgi:hypothetical protein
MKNSIDVDNETKWQKKNLLGKIITQYRETIIKDLNN